MLENHELHILRQLHHWRSAGQRAVLVTVVHTWGSSPRPPGSLMALCEDGHVAGSVSGGCVEQDLLERHIRDAGPDALWNACTPRLLTYGLSSEEAHRLGLPCGGTLQMLLEPNPDIDLLSQAIERLERGALVQRTVDIDSGAVQLHPVDHPLPLRFDGKIVAVPLGPAWRLLIIGAGDIAAYVANMALFNGFMVTVCDPRHAMLDGLDPNQVVLSNSMPDDAVRAFQPDGRSVVIALTHDPKLDDLALLEALYSPAFYVGAIGSKANAQKRHHRMTEHLGVEPQTMDRLHSPIGLPIGSKTPPEIAVSIMAEVLAARSLVRQQAQAQEATAPADVRAFPIPPSRTAPSAPQFYQRAAITEVDSVIDAIGAQCPIPILRAKRALNAMRHGDKLLVLATDSRSAQDFGLFAAQTGNTITQHFEDSSGVHHFFLTKGHGRATA
ncbi:XdhC family protein [Corticibacter populi]|uniref:XdhC family protein n=1 Tax=Corticibacter populi TaxID=1550736 RepID=A0A3M6QRL7_9BURK|nr:XdhC family protein [Corticibacter populi]RMX05688.1 XdhC family protein [Corticibacter populi]RZS31021.1 xanthine dehydrogenase accessory factor [Corticibacter populi]